MPAIVRWPAGLQKNDSGDNTFFHMCDWLPTILSFAGVEAPSTLKLDGVDQSAVLRGEVAPYHPKRCWQWNRYDPLIEYNAAIRDGDWKLVRPFVPEAFEVPDIKWLDVSMYQPEHFIENGIITDPAPEVNLPKHRPPSNSTIEKTIHWNNTTCSRPSPPRATAWSATYTPGSKTSATTSRKRAAIDCIRFRAKV